MSNRPLNVGLVGGGGGAFIVNPYQKAVFFDGTGKVTCAPLYPDPKIAMKETEKWMYPIKSYTSYVKMIEEESKKPKGEGVDYFLIVTLNHVHFDLTKRALEKSIPVFCEKPLTITFEESDQLVKLSKEKISPSVQRIPI